MQRVGEAMIRFFRWLVSFPRSEDFGSAVHDLWIIHYALERLKNGDEDGARRLAANLKWKRPQE